MTAPGYATVANTYHQRGWNPLPIPRGEKTSPPTGTTGRDGKDPTADDIASWAAIDAHALAPGADDDPDVTFRPVGCGGGIAFPAAPVTGVPTCVECRISAAVGVESWLWSHGVAELLCLLTSKKSFPPSRLPVAAMQLRMIGDVLAGPRAGIAQAIVDGHRIRWPHLPTPVGLVEMFDAYTRWNLGVLRAHGAEYAVRFPMKRQTLETIERGCRVLGVEVDR